MNATEGTTAKLVLDVSNLQTTVHDVKNLPRVCNELKSKIEDNSGNVRIDEQASIVNDMSNMTIVVTCSSHLGG